MCRALSFYSTDIDGVEKVWISELTDSHSAIATEFGLRDTPGRTLWAGEFYPDDARPSADTPTWVLDWDSDATIGNRGKPVEDHEARVRRYLERAVKRYISVSPRKPIDVSVRGWAFKRGVIRLVTGGVARAYGTSTIQRVAGGVAWAYGISTIQRVAGGAAWAYGGKILKDDRKAAKASK